MPKRKSTKSIAIRNRVIERRRMDVSQVAGNEGNWREHPETQKRALEGILEEIGQVGELYAYYSERNGGDLTLIDGHMRQGLGGEWDVAVTDLTDAEADKLLLTYNPVAAMAATNKGRLEALMSNVQTSNAKVAAMLKNLAEKEHIVPKEPAGKAVEFADEFAILIQCESEKQQADLLERFLDEGLKCRSLIA